MKISSSNFLKLPKATKPSVYKDCDWKETKILLSFRCSKNLIIHDKVIRLQIQQALRKAFAYPMERGLSYFHFSSGLSWQNQILANMSPPCKISAL